MSQWKGMSRWNSMRDLFRVARCRRLQADGRYSDALRILEVGARPGSIYSRLFPLYQLWLLVIADDPRRFSMSTELEKQKWPISTENDRYFEAYRRYITSAIAREWQKTREAGHGLQTLNVSSFIKNTIPPPSRQFLQELN